MNKSKKIDWIDLDHEWDWIFGLAMHLFVVHVEQQFVRNKLYAYSISKWSSLVKQTLKSFLNNKKNESNWSSFYSHVLPYNVCETFLIVIKHWLVSFWYCWWLDVIIEIGKIKPNVHWIAMRIKWIWYVNRNVCL